MGQDSAANKPTIVANGVWGSLLVEGERREFFGTINALGARIFL
jgi:hypothetical protein